MRHLTEGSSYEDLFQAQTKTQIDVINSQPKDCVYFIQEASVFKKIDYYIHKEFEVRKVKNFLYLGCVPEIYEDY